MRPRLRRHRRRLLLVLGVALLVVVVGRQWPWPWRWDPLALAELDTCPACYGVTLCPSFMAGSLGLDLWSLPNLLNALGAKNVYMATLNDEPVVLKKLGHAHELRAMDAKLCDAAAATGAATGECHAGEAVLRLSDLYSALEAALRPPPAEAEGKGVVLCPSTQGLDKLLEKVLARNRGVSTRTVMANLWTLLNINAEPLILQVIPAEEGWPVPRYLGACGRVVVEEYAGVPLASFHGAPWGYRASLALRLLQAADNFTNAHPHFRFYLTDVSADNVAVSSRGDVSFVDVENVIILDKNTPNQERPISWRRPHVSETYDCESCLAFSTADICSHHLSDHNFYAVCQQLLAPTAPPAQLPGGLLHGAPQDLRLLLEQCAHSTLPLGRLTAAHRIMALLSDHARVHTQQPVI